MEKKKSATGTLKSINNELFFSCDASQGIERKKSGNSFSYLTKGKKVSDKQTLIRIKSLGIPPAWKNVWICKNENGHLQATGRDARNRKQYIYHPRWNEKRSEEKYYHLFEFGKVLPQIRKQIQKDISSDGLTIDKVIATVISLMDQTYIRIGNNSYEKENGSYGLTTLKDRHVTLKGDEMQLSFIGKKGIHHSISLKSKKLARIVKQCRDIPGKELFQYYDETGNRHPIDSGKVNAYIKKIAEADFTAKDFRTWAGSLNILRAFKKMESTDKSRVIKSNINKALEFVSEKLGNTKTVCRKYYVHPEILSLYENNSLHNYFKGDMNAARNLNLSPEEKVLMCILKSTRSHRKKVA